MVDGSWVTSIKYYLCFKNIFGSIKAGSWKTLRIQRLSWVWCFLFLIYIWFISEVSHKYKGEKTSFMIYFLFIYLLFNVVGVLRNGSQRSLKYTSQKAIAFRTFRGCLVFSVSISYYSISITYHSKIVGPTREACLDLFSNFVFITQFSDFWVMSYENWKCIWGVFKL